MKEEFNSTTGEHSGASLCSEYMGVDDCQNALLHIADDHPCCKTALLAIRETMLKMQSEKNAIKKAVYVLVRKDFGATVWDETCEQSARELRSLFPNVEGHRPLPAGVAGAKKGKS
jgi:hypothetical protein